MNECTFCHTKNPPGGLRYIGVSLDLFTVGCRDDLGCTGRKAATASTTCAHAESPLMSGKRIVTCRQMPLYGCFGCSFGYCREHVIDGYCMACTRAIVDAGIIAAFTGGVAPSD